MHPSSNDTSAAIDRWVASGIITTEQATRIRADLATHAPRRGSLVAEALGYLGGVIVLVGLGLALSLRWDSLGTEGRLAFSIGITLALIVAGIPVPIARLGAAGIRLRGVLWAAATVGAAISLGLFGDDVLELEFEQVMLLWAAGGAVVSAALWVVNRHVLQHLATITALLLAAYWGTDTVTEAARTTPDSLPGVLSSLAVWLVGAVWLGLSLRDVIPRRTGAVFGALGAIVGGLLMLGYYWGPVFALGTMVALVVGAVALRDLAVLALASIGTLIVLPFAVDRYLPGGVLATALALVAAGLALVATGVYTARRRHPIQP